MTTNAIDKLKKIIASDSRWSISAGDEILYVDDTGFDKIANRPVGCIICAGDAKLIEMWRLWFLSPVINTANFPPFDRMDANSPVGITISYIQKPDGRILFSRGVYAIFGEDAMFSGSGAVIAMECYGKNRCAKTSIETAAAIDPATGGETKFVELETNRHNLSSQPVALADVQTQLGLRGIVMNTLTKKVTPIKDYMADQNGVMRAVLKGEMSLSAPTGQPYRPWTDAEKAEFKKVMDGVAAQEAMAASND